MSRLWKTILGWVGGLLLLALLFAGYLYWLDSPPSGAPMGEVISADEEYRTGQIIAAAIDDSIQSRAKLMGNPPPPTPSTAQTAPGFNSFTYRRDVHSKAHGCVAATFTVQPVADHNAIGLFATPTQYEAVIRFSSGSPDVRPDAAKDVRGVAVKVFGVPGPKLLPSEGNSQDFVMMNNPVFFIRTLEGYTQFNKLLAAGEPFDYFLSKRNPLTWHLRELLLGTLAQKPPPASLVTTRYWSASSYALGSNAYVKYSLLPHARNQVRKVTLNAKNQFDELRLELAEQAKAGGAKFDFAIQLQVIGKNMPIEDTTVEWKESDSPFVTVATIELKTDPTANSASLNERCESLAFNPWHALPAHRPAGVMNRVRKALYDAMARFRRAKNCELQCSAACAAGSATDACQTCLQACPALQPPAIAAR